MVFAHDTSVALQAAVALANSALEPDTMTTVAELDAWYAAHSYTGRRDRTRAELDAVRAVRPRLRAFLTSGPEQAAAEVNAILAESSYDETDGYIFAWQRHLALVQALRLPEWAVGTSYAGIAAGQLPQGLAAEDLIATS